MAENRTIQVEVAYARPEIQVIIPVEVAVGATVLEAIRHSGVLEKFPEIDLAQNKVGVFSKIVPVETVLQEKDRVEIYRDLLADPKESRRARADKKIRKEESEPTE